METVILGTSRRAGKASVQEIFYKLKDWQRNNPNKKSLILISPDCFYLIESALAHPSLFLKPTLKNNHFNVFGSELFIDCSLSCNYKIIEQHDY